jgi:hypothetical protein
MSILRAGEPVASARTEFGESMAGHKTVNAVLCLLAGSLCRAWAQDMPSQAPAAPDAATITAAEPAAPLVKIDALVHTVTLSTDGSFRDVVHSELESSNLALIAQLAQFPITYDAATQTLDITDAYTLKPDGRKEMVGPNGIFDRAAPAGNNILSSMTQKVIVYPDVQPGDRMVYDGTITGKATFPGQFTFDRLMAPIATVENESVAVTAPKSMPLYTDTQQLSLQKKEDADTVTYSVTYSNANSVADDTNPISRFDRVARFSVSTFKSYADLGRAFAAVALPKIQLTPNIQSRADSIVAGTSAKRDQAQKLYDWVSNNIRYVAIELGTGGIIPHDATSILANGYGDCKDQAVLYAALLSAEKINAALVLIHSGNTYTVAKVPTLGSFDHVIVYLPQFDIYADTTTTGIVPFGFLPQQEYGKPIVLVSAQGASFKQTPVPGAKDASFAYTLDAKLDDIGREDSASSWTAAGSFQEPLRAVGKAIQFDTQGAIANTMFNARGTPQAKGGFSLPPDAGGDFQIRAAYTTSGRLLAYTQNRSFTIPDVLRITPLTSDLFFGPIFNARYQKADAIPCHSGRGVDDETLEFSASHRLSRLPDDKKVSTDHITYTSHWSLDGNKVHVHRELEARFDQVVCTNPVKDEALSALQNIRSDLATQISFLQDGAPTAPGNGG